MDTSDSDAEYPATCLRRVTLKNYKSIEHCAVDLKALTLLVGPNGAGKSNFIDGIRLTTDAMRSTLENAVRERGGISEVRRRSRGHPTHFGVRLDLTLPKGRSATYAYQVAARKNQTFEVQREECHVWVDGKREEWFSAEKGRLRSTSSIAGPSVAANGLLLPLLAGTEAFQPVALAISNIGFYALNLDRIRELQNPDMGDLLTRDGSNLASVVRRMDQSSPAVLDRVTEYLASVVPGVRSVSARTLGPKETIEFRQEVAGDAHPWRYLAANVSDGTLRALGVLIAVFQGEFGHRGGIPLVAIEEPEVAIHPGAALRLMDALLEASRDRQILLTTHSPDLLDHPGLDVGSVLAVQSSGGTTELGPVEASTRDAVRDNLYTVGELLRLEQVHPDMFDVQRQATQLRLFGAVT